MQLGTVLRISMNILPDQGEVLVLLLLPHLWLGKTPPHCQITSNITASVMAKDTSPD